MSDRLSLSVEEFFNDVNWQGVVKQQVLSQSEVQPKSLSSWQDWTVEEFFSNANWQGRTSTQETKHTNSVTFSMTLPVEQLFRYFAWEGKPKVAALSPLKSEKVAQPSTPAMNINNFSELF